MAVITGGLHSHVLSSAFGLRARERAWTTGTGSASAPQFACQHSEQAESSSSSSPDGSPPQQRRLGYHTPLERFPPSQCQPRQCRYVNSSAQSPWESRRASQQPSPQPHSPHCSPFPLPQTHVLHLPTCPGSLPGYHHISAMSLHLPCSPPMYCRRDASATPICSTRPSSPSSLVRVSTTL